MNEKCFFTIITTIGVAWFYGKNKADEFLSIEIVEGVSKISKKTEPRFWIPLACFAVGTFTGVEIWIEDNGGWGPFGEDGMVTNFITNGLLKIFAPFLLWIGGAIILGKIGAKGPEFLVKLFGKTALLSDIKRGLTNSTSSDTVNRLAVIMLLTLSIVTLAAIQGYTGTDVDERTASADIGADIQVQFVDPVSKEQAEAAVITAIDRIDSDEVRKIESSASIGTMYPTAKGSSGVVTTYVIFDGTDDTLLWDKQAVPNSNLDKTISGLSSDKFTAGEGAIGLLDLPDNDELDSDDTGFEYKITLEYPEYKFRINETGFPEIDFANSTYRETQVTYLGEHQWIPGIPSTDTSNSIIIGEKSYRKLVGPTIADNYVSTTWFFELCDQNDKDCKDALGNVAVEVGNSEIVFSSNDWGSSHEEVETNGGLIFGTQGLLSLQFMVSSVAVVASAFVFLSLVLDQRSKELAILQAIGASPNQIRKLVLFEILSIIIVSMTLGVLLGVGVAQTFNGFFFVFGYIFQIFLGNATPISRELVWPWAEIILVNISVLIAVIIALVLTTRKVLNANLAMILKGE